MLHVTFTGVDARGRITKCYYARIHVCTGTEAADDHHRCLHLRLRNLHVFMCVLSYFFDTFQTMR